MFGGGLTVSPYTYLEGDTNMLKKTIEFEDFNGDVVKRDFYFNLTKAEVVELEVSEGNGIVDLIEKITKERNNYEIVRIFKKVILLAYGEKSADGLRFIKTEELSTAFEQTNAYSELFMELASDAGAAEAFVNGILPKMPEKPKVLPPKGE